MFPGQSAGGKTPIHGASCFLRKELRSLYQLNYMFRKQYTDPGLLEKNPRRIQNRAMESVKGGSPPRIDPGAGAEHPETADAEDFPSRGRAGFSTADLARAAGTHVNTVRFYEEMGFLPPAVRGPNGYRLWTREHRDQMVFARKALHGLWPGRRIRASALALVRKAAAEGPEAALAAARDHRELVRQERARAEEAAEFLEAWARGRDGSAGFQDAPRLGPREAARAAGATTGQVRNWERNRLVRTPRQSEGGRRTYGPGEIGRLRVIRSLLLAGYSVMAIYRMIRALDRGRDGDLREVLDTPARGEEARTAFDRWLTSLEEQEARAEDLILHLETRACRIRTLQ